MVPTWWLIIKFSVGKMNGIFIFGTTLLTSIAQNNQCINCTHVRRKLLSNTKQLCVWSVWQLSLFSFLFSSCLCTFKKWSYMPEALGKAMLRSSCLHTQLASPLSQHTFSHTFLPFGSRLVLLVCTRRSLIAASPKRQTQTFKIQVSILRNIINCCLSKSEKSRWMPVYVWSAGLELGGN